MKFAALALRALSETGDATLKRFVENGETTRYSRNHVRSAETAPAPSAKRWNRIPDTISRRTTK
ncbi:hypothetical protein GCM10009000_083310 [Halobacterium noricense]|uniref:Uncharacterized protein n=1 Tax=Haladaptatus pallidirubidus TaxID=1008152 RepID=A0AAV3UQW0_9EURY